MCIYIYIYIYIYSIYIQGAYKLLEDFVSHNLGKKFRKIVKFLSITHSEHNIWNSPRVATAISWKKRKSVLEGNGCLTDRAYLVFGGNGSIAWTSTMSHMGRTSNAFKVTMKLQTFIFQMVITSCISVKYL
jgi:hypothetical protein